MSEALDGEVAEESLDHVELRGAGGGEVQVEAGMFGEPVADFLCLWVAR
jgi:hypothetical protein